MPHLNELLAANPLFTGGLFMAAIGWVAVQARNLPLKLWQLLRRTFTTSVTLYNDEYMFHRFEVFFARHPGSKKSRKYNVSICEGGGNTEEDTVLRARLTPGDGLHLLREQGRFVLLSKSTHMDSSTKSGPDLSVRKSLTVTILGRNRQFLDQLIESVYNTGSRVDRIEVRVWTGGGYTMGEMKRKRPLRTIYIDNSIKNAIVNDMRAFENKAAWYHEQHIPHRRGYLLQGPPGTGKTSLILALASEFDKPVYTINPSNCNSDAAFLEALNSAGPSIIAIEDVDSCISVREREHYKDAQPVPGHDTTAKGVTLSGILNAIDGAASRDGRIIIMTTNHPDILDAALIRPGRVDRIFTLGHADRNLAAQMFQGYGAPGDPAEFLDSLSYPISQAELQNLLMAHMDANT